MMDWRQISSLRFRALLLAALLMGAPVVQGCKGGDEGPTDEEDAGDDLTDVRDEDLEDEDTKGDEEDVKDEDDVKDEEDADDEDDVKDEDEEEEEEEEDDELSDPRFDCDEEGAPFGGGAGMPGDPFLVCSPGHLEAIGAASERLSRNYVLTRRIDMSGVADFAPIGSVETPFQGHFDGNERGIRNLRIQESGRLHVGLFAAVGGNGEVIDLTLEAVEVEGAVNVGALAGANLGGELRRISVDGRVEGRDIIGGVVGLNDGGFIISSQSVVSVSGENSVGGLVGMNDEGQIIASYSVGVVEGTQNIGGLAGMNFDGQVQDSYSVAEVKGGVQAGGLIGANAGGIRTSYAAGAVTGAEIFGGLVGTEIDGQVTNSYWDKESSGLDESAQGVGRTTAEFAEAVNFISWGFGTIWKMGTAPDGEERPVLNWQE